MQLTMPNTIPIHGNCPPRERRIKLIAIQEGDKQKAWVSILDQKWQKPIAQISPRL